MAVAVGFACLMAHSDAVRADAPRSRSKRAVTVADSIEMTLMGEAEARHFDRSPALFSPDRRQFVVVTQRGSIESNTNTYTLLGFASDEVFKRSSPRVFATFESASNSPGISNVSWKDDHTVLMLGASGEEVREVVALDTTSGNLSRLTKHPTDIVFFSSAPLGGTLTYFARPALASVWNDDTRRDGLLIDDQKLADLLIGHAWKDDEAGVATPFELYVQDGAAPARRIQPPDGWLLVPSASFAFISPSGKRAILKCRAALGHRLPESWKEYSGRSSMAYFLVDFDSGNWRQLLDAPAPSSNTPDIVWLSDRSIVAANVYLPLKGSADDERRLRASEAFAVEIDVEAPQVSKLAQGRYELARDLMDVSRRPGEIVLRKAGHPADPEGSSAELRTRAFRKVGAHWQESDFARPQAGSRDDIAVLVAQDMNAPARLVAVNTETHETAVLLDPNPQFAALRFGKVEEITWTGTDGSTSKGGLFLPPSPGCTVKCPLVIQTHGWSSRKFEIDGRSGNAGYAAQALAGHHIIVAQLPDDPSRWDESPREAPSATAAFEGLIDHLDSRGLIDRERVGLQGWSRTGLHVRHALTFSHYPFAAATVVDAMEGSYGQYLAWLNVGSAAVSSYESINGARPFGPGLEVWMQNATGFNLDRVKTPVRSLALRHGFTLLSEWEWFAGLKYLGVPVELIWIPDAAHSPVRPRERLVSQQATVDWFRFWLKAEEDPDPARAEQYARWRRMREDWSARRESEAPASNRYAPHHQPNRACTD